MNTNCLEVGQLTKPCQQLTSSKSQESKSPAHLHPSIRLVILLQCIMTSYLIMLGSDLAVRRTVTTGDFKNKVYFHFHSSTLTLFLQNFRQNNHCHQPSSPSTLPSLPKVFYSLCAVSSFFVKDFAILSSAHAHNLCDVHHGSVNCCAYWRDSEHAGQNSFLRFTCNAWTEFILAFFQERGSLLP